MRALLIPLAIAAGTLACGAPGSPGSRETSDGDIALPALAAPAGAVLDTAIFAGGCFWCVEPPFDKLPGVISTTSGYTAGRTANPTYEAVSKGGTGHTEAVQIVFDPGKVSYERLLTVFWRNVDPFARDRQFCDRGDQYRAGIYTRDAAQQRAAEASRRAIATRFQEPIVTEIQPAGQFYAAEAYHQDYYKKNPVRYKYYRHRCGRDARLKAIWGSEAGG